MKESHPKEGEIADISQKKGVYIHHRVAVDTDTLEGAPVDIRLFWKMKFNDIGSRKDFIDLGDLIIERY